MPPCNGLVSSYKTLQLRMPNGGSPCAMRKGPVSLCLLMQHWRMYRDRPHVASVALDGAWHFASR